MFDSLEKLYLIKLLQKLKYSELDIMEMNELAFNPIVNNIIEKLNDSKVDEYIKKQHQTNSNIKKFCFEFENNIGLAIKDRLKYLDWSTFETISKWSKEDTEGYVKDILGPISYEKVEFDRLVNYLTTLANDETNRLKL